MPIIRFDFSYACSPDPRHQELESNKEWAGGAYCPLSSDNSLATRERNKHALVLWETHVGLCLIDTERNGYDDSDFIMTVWNPEKGCAEEICYATTRGWTYPAMGSSVDATEEVRALYLEWVEREKQVARKAKRLSQAAKLCDFRCRVRCIASKNQVSYPRLLKFLRRQHPERAQRIESLLTAALRSPFRLGLKDQLLQWLKDPQPTYRSPFSPRQWAYV